ncbi:two-CW domain-containing protein [Thermodesulfobacteriota bacterium]
MNCWEFMKCGYEEGGVKAESSGVCPAFPDYGKSCARIISTKCKDDILTTFSQKIRWCRLCEFYNSPNYDKTDVDIYVIPIDD